MRSNGKLGHFAAFVSGVGLTMLQATAAPRVTEIIGTPTTRNVQPRSLSSDGSTVVGYLTFISQPAIPFRWTPAGGLQLMPLPAGFDNAIPGCVGSNGAAAGGSFRVNSLTRAVVWTPDLNPIVLGTLYPNGNTLVSAVSDDATFAIGKGLISNSVFRPFVWTPSVGFSELPLISGAVGASLNAMTPDATRIVGASNYNNTSSVATVWDHGAQPRALPVPAGTMFSNASIVSRDGSTIIGTAGTAVGRWRLEGDFEPLTKGSSGLKLADAACANREGTVIGGAAAQNGSRAAAIWTPLLGVVLVGDVLSSYGIDMGDARLFRCIGLSADHRTLLIEGYRDRAGTPWAGWLIEDFPDLTTPCPGDIVADFRVDDLDFGVFAESYAVGLCEDASMPIGCEADLDRSGGVDDADFTLFATAYDRLACGM